MVKALLCLAIAVVVFLVCWFGFLAWANNGEAWFISAAVIGSILIVICLLLIYADLLTCVRLCEEGRSEKRLPKGIVHAIGAGIAVGILLALITAPGQFPTNGTASGTASSHTRQRSTLEIMLTETELQLKFQVPRTMIAKEYYFEIGSEVDEFVHVEPSLYSQHFIIDYSNKRSPVIKCPLSRMQNYILNIMYVQLKGFLDDWSQMTYGLWKLRCTQPLQLVIVKYWPPEQLVQDLDLSEQYCHFFEALASRLVEWAQEVGIVIAVKSCSYSNVQGVEAFEEYPVRVYIRSTAHWGPVSGLYDQKWACGVVIDIDESKTCLGTGNRIANWLEQNMSEIIASYDVNPDTCPFEYFAVSVASYGDPVTSVWGTFPELIDLKVYEIPVFDTF